LLPPKDFFIVEISTEGDILMIAAFSITTSESYLIEQHGSKAQKTIARYHCDFALMASCLHFQGNRLALKSHSHRVNQEATDEDFYPTDDTNNTAPLDNEANLGI
jgi:hypothetical protein